MCSTFCTENVIYFQCISTYSSSCTSKNISLHFKNANPNFFFCILVSKYKSWCKNRIHFREKNTYDISKIKQKTCQKKKVSKYRTTLYLMYLSLSLIKYKKIHACIHAAYTALFLCYKVLIQALNQALKNVQYNVFITTNKCTKQLFSNYKEKKD